MSSKSARLSRRDLLRGAIALAAPLALGLTLYRGTSTGGTVAEAQILPLTPQCAEPEDLTPAQTEGPFFTPNSPERQSLLESGSSGSRLVVTGLVLSRGCQPLAGALVDFWQADDTGAYDNVGYRYRGHQYTDVDGRYLLETVVPGLYPGRTRHIHVKVQAPGGSVLTTQLYFPGEPRNQQDGIFRPELLMALADEESGSKAGQFDFVVTSA